MSWTEVILAVVMNAQKAAGFFCFISFVGFLIGSVFYFVNKTHINRWCPKWEKEDENLDSSDRSAIAYMMTGKMILKLAGATFLVVLPITIMPTVDDLWKVRIGLIKLNLASPENIQKGADVIERIGKKLECKYVGCEEAKEKK